jgi:hypothetical protein
MSDSWLDVIKPLEEGEEIEDSFPCQMDYIKGFLVLTNKRLFFIQGGGRFNKVFSKYLEQNYVNVDEVKLVPGYRLRLRFVDDPYWHLVETIDVPASDITGLLENYLDVEYFDAVSRA